ncbi:MAG: 5-guanidino-2-oxopentanoate decarboxylase [Actinobacteria bacterium]|nr:5-guanidino-2-oxopentanoate decarboxylase [Actinomycetota bacterium]
MREREESVGEATVRMLAEAGTEVSFGIPGIHTLELFRGLHSAGVRHVLNRSEQGAVFAADGYARVTGRPGVSLLISGPGVTNAATPIAQAYHDSVPLLIVSTVVPESERSRRWGALHELPDQGATMASLTAFSEHIEDPEALPEAFARAFRLFEFGRPRPVHIEIPIDLLGRPAPSLSYRPPRGERPAPAAGDANAAASRLAAAARPKILLGGGALDAGAAARRVAERIGAPVALTLNAKGALPDEHPLSLGTTLPTEATIRALADADVLLAVGTEFSPIDSYYSPAGIEPRGELIRVDIDPAQMDAAFAPAIPIVADAALGLGAIDAALAGLTVGPDHDGVEEAARIRGEVTWWPRAEPLLPLIEAIGTALPPDHVVACDSTQLAYIGQNLWPGGRPRSWLIPAGLGTLGPALPMAIGGAVGRPQATALCVIGDGGLLFTIGEMAAAASLRLPLVMLLWNNDGYEEMRDEMDELGIPQIGTEASAEDYGTIAAGFGWARFRPGSVEEVVATLTDCRSPARPTVIELTPDLLA